MKSKPSESFSILIIISCIAAVAVSFLVSQDITGTLIDVAVAIFMVIVILIGIKGKRGLNSLDGAIADLNKMVDFVNDASKDPAIEMESVFDDEVIFSNPILEQAYKNYRSECDRLYQPDAEYKYCDVADYINTELLNQIANASYNDLVGGVMTGLGILGTFVGLTIGLKGFDSSTSETMRITLTEMIDGIKVAFLTSIFGMIYSITFNFFYHNRIRTATELLNDFLDVYYENVAQRPDNDGFTRLVNLESQQKDSMSQFAEDISLSFANQVNDTFVPTMQSISASMQSQAESLPGAISTAISDAVLPPLTEIKEDFSKMSDQLIQMQGHNMETIAADFVKHMDQAMGSQLDKLGKSIASLCEWQESVSENMKNVIERLMASGQNLAKVDEKISAAAGNFETMVERVENSQHELLIHYTNVLGNCEKIGDMTKRQSEQMDELLTKEKASLKSLEDMDKLVEEQNALIKETFENLIQMISASLREQQLSLNASMAQNYTQLQEKLALSTEQVNQVLETNYANLKADAERINELHETMIKSMNEASAQMKNASDSMTSASADLTSNLDTAMSRTFRQMDVQLAEIEKHLSGTISEIREVTEVVPRTIQMSSKSYAENTEEYLKEIQNAISIINTTISDRDNAITALLREQSNAIQALSQNN